jgi:hypothetical protein
MLRLVLCVLAILLVGCSDRNPPPPSMEDAPDAAARAEALDRDLRQLQNLSGPRRQEAEQAFGKRLRADLEVCRGTRYENKPLYMLVQWTLVHGGPSAPTDVLPLLDRLDILPAPAYRNAGKALRVQALLRSGRMSEARQIAEGLEREVPEFGALRRVQFHEQVGQPAPPMPGTAVGGDDAPTEPFVLVCFIGMPDAEAEGWLTPLRKAAGPRLRVVAVATAGDLLAAATVGSAWGVDVRWLRQNDPALAAWKVPGLPAALLLGPGPQRLILAVDPQPADLLKVSGATP